ncbi:hypothetical protein BDV95DRAFT_44870 [Massariosphaeria phaeospora]|uniref:Uncharacterized protein n=1 Tax=Massariosphaeria phaeospora TaxID=100035 RepID=A0A7C8I5X7_9PLEO|nr:hypothetical protein BDV95DRAFT_44870 [Massariosphaeria phaeospora]
MTRVCPSTRLQVRRRRRRRLPTHARRQSSPFKPPPLSHLIHPVPDSPDPTSCHHRALSACPIFEKVVSRLTSAVFSSFSCFDAYSPALSFLGVASSGIVICTLHAVLRHLSHTAVRDSPSAFLLPLGCRSSGDNESLHLITTTITGVVDS